MRSNKPDRIIGISFILAILTSIVGGLMIQDSFSLSSSSVIIESNLLYLGVFLEMIDAIAVLLIIIFITPVLTKFNKRLTLVYRVMRYLEFGVLTVAALVVLLFPLLNISVVENLNDFRLLILNLITPVLFSIGGVTLFYLLFKHRLVPRYISIWGLVGSILIGFLNIFEINPDYAMIFALPIIINELYLGGYLIIKGFKK